MQRLKMHPDLGGDHWQASLINEAFATLSNPQKRAAYDRDMRSRPDVTEQPAPQAAAVHETTGGNMAAKGHCAFCGTPHRAEVGSEDSCQLCLSPLFMPVDAHNGSSLTRLIKRMPRSFPLTLFQGWPNSVVIAGQTTDLSPAGLCFLGQEDLPPGKIVKIDSALCAAVAQIRHCTAHARPDQGKWEIGVKFITLRFNVSQGNFVSTVA